MNGTQDEQQHLRARIRCLLSMREIPRVIPSSSAELSACDACGNPIAQRSSQYEIGFSTLTFRLDTECFQVWAEEMLRNHPSPEPRRSALG
jgi:hypothetical protein